MDDIQLIIYIALIAFGLLSRLLKSKKAVKKKGGKASVTNEKNSSPSKQPTFEDLLKEFTEVKSPEPQVKSPPAKQANFDDDEIRRVYDQARLASAKKEPLLEHNDRHTGNFNHFSGYSEADTEEKETEWAQLFNDHDAAKRAIIMSEIINRKY